MLTTQEEENAYAQYGSDTKGREGGHTKDGSMSCFLRCHHSLGPGEGCCLTSASLWNRTLVTYWSSWIFKEHCYQQTLIQHLLCASKMTGTHFYKMDSSV
jgi:hypothetical protein